MTHLPSRAVVAEHHLRHQLGATIRIGGLGRRVFIGDAMLGQAVHGCRGRENELVDTRIRTGRQQVARIAGVVAVVLERIAHRFGHNGVSRKVQHGIDAVMLQHRGHQRGIAHIAHHQLGTLHGLAITRAQVVDHHHMLAT